VSYQQHKGYQYETGKHECHRERWRSRLDDCSLDHLLGKKLDGELVFPPPIFIRLPDLYADDADFNVFGNTSIEVFARTGNSGSARSADYDVTVVVTVTGNGIPPQVVSLTARAPGLAVGARQFTAMGYVTVPDRMYDYDLSTVIHVDTANQMNGGEVRELDETNNTFNDGTCRVFGKNPDTSVTGCR